MRKKTRVEKYKSFIFSSFEAKTIQNDIKFYHCTVYIS